MWKSVRDFKRILVPGISEVDGILISLFSISPLIALSLSFLFVSTSTHIIATAIIKGEVYQTLFYPEDEAELDLKQLFSKSDLPVSHPPFIPHLFSYPHCIFLTKSFAVPSSRGSKILCRYMFVRIATTNQRRSRVHVCCTHIDSNILFLI